MPTNSDAPRVMLKPCGPLLLEQALKAAGLTLTIAEFDQLAAGLDEVLERVLRLSLTGSLEAYVVELRSQTQYAQLVEALEGLLEELHRKETDEKYGFRTWAIEIEQKIRAILDRHVTMSQSTKGSPHA